MTFRQIGHTTSQYGQTFFLKLLVLGMGLLSLKLRHWLYLDQILFTINRASLPHNTLEGSCGILKQKQKDVPQDRETRATTSETMLCVIQMVLTSQESNYLFSNNPLKDFSNGRSE